MFNKRDPKREQCMLTGKFRNQGYDWWWHSLTAKNAETGEERPFFLEFFVCNPALAEDIPTLGQHPDNKKEGKRPSYLMVKAGTWLPGGGQFHRFFPWKDVRLNMGVPFSVKADDCFCDGNNIRGRISISEDEAEAHPEWMCDAGTIEFDLKIEKKIAFNVGYGAGGLFRKLKAFEMYWHADGIKTKYSGTITYNGVKYIVDPEDCNGYADKNWGSNFTSPWVWLSSNDMTSRITGKKLENSAFEIGGGRPKIFFLALNRKLLGGIFYEGKCFEFNFSKFWTGSRTKFECGEDNDEIVWHVEQRTWRTKLITDIRCKKSDMLLINYESPDGMKRYTDLWNGGNGYGILKLYKGKRLIDEIEVKRVGCEYGEYNPDVI